MKIKSATVNICIGLQDESGKMVESQERVSEQSGNFEMDIEWQPCIWVYTVTMNKHKEQNKLSDKVDSKPSNEQLIISAG